MSKRKAKWINRTLIVGNYLCLCLSEKQFKSAKKHLKVTDGCKFVEAGKDAAVHTYETDGKLASIVCLQVTDNITDIQVYALLVHEAVHVWQHFCDSINELSPSREFEAYSIQSISQSLMIRYNEMRGSAKCLK